MERGFLFLAASLEIIRFLRDDLVDVDHDAALVSLLRNEPCRPENVS